MANNTAFRKVTLVPTPCEPRTYREIITFEDDDNGRDTIPVYACNLYATEEEYDLWVAAGRPTQEDLDEFYARNVERGTAPGFWY